MSKGSRPRPYSVPLAEVHATHETIFGVKPPKERYVPPPLPGEDMQVRVKENTEDIGRCGCGRSPTGKCVGWHGLTEDEFKSRKELYETGKVDLGGVEIK